MLDLHFTPFPNLESERLLLRQITEADAPALFFMRSDEAMMRYLDRPRAKSIDDVLPFLQRIADGLSRGEDITWGLSLKANPAELVGTIGFWRILKEHYRAEIGYALVPAHQKQGLLAEAMQAVLAYGFQHMGLHSVEANINPGNAASAAVLQRAGFVQEAYFRENFYYNGKFLDSVIYCKLNPGAGGMGCDVD